MITALDGAELAAICCKPGASRGRNSSCFFRLAERRMSVLAGLVELVVQLFSQLQGKVEKTVWNRLLFDLLKQNRNIAADAPADPHVVFCNRSFLLRHSDLCNEPIVEPKPADGCPFYISKVKTAYPEKSRIK